MSEGWLDEIGYEECLELLRSRSVGRISVVLNDAPILLPVNYRLVETSGPTWVALRTRSGNVIDRVPAKVAFEIDDVDVTHSEGWSVLVRGTLLRVDPDAVEFRERFDPEPWVADRNSWLVIEPFAVTGRRLRATSPEWLLDLDAHE